MYAHMTPEGHTEQAASYNFWDSVYAMRVCECVERGVTCRRGSDQWPGETCSPRPAVTACPWASAGTDPAGAGCPHTQSLARPRPRSDTRPAVYSEVDKS